MKASTLGSGDGVKARKKAVRCHVAGKLVVVPEQPAQDLEALVVVPAAEPAISLGQPEQDGGRLRVSLA
jgi:hypothetical protein